MIKNIFIKLLTTGFVLCIPILLLAQPASGKDPDSVPIDGGLSLLVAAGVGYGAKKMKEKKNENNKS